MLTHHSVISIMLSLREVHSIWPNVPQDVSLGLVPYFHIFGLAVPCSGDLYEGKTVVSLSGFEPQTFLSAIANYKVSFAITFTTHTVNTPFYFSIQVDLGIV